MTSPPKVTVFIPVHNRERYIGAAIESVLAQSFTDFELLVVDDGSTDRTPSIIRSYADPRIRFVINETNLGIPGTRNRGLELARGQYFANLDSDDLMQHTRLERQVAYLDAHPSCALVGSHKRRIDEKGRIKPKFSHRPLAPEFVRSRLLFRCCIANTSVMARTNLLNLYKYNPEFPVCQDYDIFVRMSYHYDLANLKEPLVLYRRHGKQVSARRDRTLEMQRVIMARELQALGVDFDSTDLNRHARLARPRTQYRPDREDITWTTDWLARLERANADTRRYTPEAFRSVLNRVWWWQILKARPSAVPRALRASVSQVARGRPL